MIQSIRIENYKSLVDVQLDLGRVNVFIGANGSGKSNILEAVAMLSSERDSAINIKYLSDKGVRIAKPSLTFSSFLSRKNPEAIKGQIRFENGKSIESIIKCENPNDIYADWHSENKYADVQGNGAKDGCTVSPSAPIITLKDDAQLSGLDDKVRNLIYAESFKGERAYLSNYLIYSLWTDALRGITNNSTVRPLGINGEGLDLLLNTFDNDETELLAQFEKKCISWIDDFFYDEGDVYKKQGYKLGRSTSNLYFRDKYMQKKENNNVFSAENANEGALHLLFYLALFISKKTPSFFSIDNIETGMNPKLCRTLVEFLCELSLKKNKQAVITTHNPAVLDGLNLYDDNQRLFVVSRRDDGQTKVERIKLKPNVEGQQKKMLSELWMRGFLGGVPDNF